MKSEINFKEILKEEAKNILENDCFGQPHRFIAYILEYMVDVWIRSNLNNILFT